MATKEQRLLKLLRAERGDGDVVEVACVVTIRRDGEAIHRMSRVLVVGEDAEGDVPLADHAIADMIAYLRDDGDELSGVVDGILSEADE